MRILMVAIAVVAACDGDVTAASLTCRELGDRLHARAQATSRACDVATDCAAIGWPARDDGFPSCSCGVSFAQSCSGDLVNAGAWAGDATAAAMLAEFDARCVRGDERAEAPILCDCGPAPVACTDHTCEGGTLSCF